MNRCPISYTECKGKYSREGLKTLSPKLLDFNDLEYSADEQRLEAARRSERMSIQGVQPKISAVLNIKKQKFDIVDIKGKFIIKPQHHIYPQLPENEDLTMKMASACGIETPVHGMIYSSDGSLSYFIKRFDRQGRGNKLPLEDFAQLAGETRDTKYNYSTEKLIKLIENFCTFPHLEKVKFYKRFLFNFLTGNEDMHLKNYSLISRNDKVEFSPAYDFLNSSIVIGADAEELALSLKGKKKNLNRDVLTNYLSKERLSLNDTTINNTLAELNDAKQKWFDLIENSFLYDELKEKYQALLINRMDILF
jgi:serine/threonine-protein kinase HipA